MTQPTHTRRPRPMWAARTRCTTPPLTLVPPVPAGVVVACPRCEVASGPYPTRGEALLLADRHDQVHHRGRRTAQLSEQVVCESCRRAPATATWARPSAGAPFALCAGCLPDSPTSPTGADSADRAGGLDGIEGGAR